jgi:hypothetical protein
MQENAIRDLLNQEAPLRTVLRLLCLYSVVVGGLKLKNLEEFKRDILQVRLSPGAHPYVAEQRIGPMAIATSLFWCTSQLSTSYAVPSPAVRPLRRPGDRSSSLSTRSTSKLPRILPTSTAATRRSLSALCSARWRGMAHGGASRTRCGLSRARRSRKRSVWTPSRPRRDVRILSSARANAR